ncbi:hypothetical protein KIL84_002684 [Mauremys mutica]|uniref:Uncharacterized protein n=1 Tax=Mauremys mutica TaxID=74926 RepID=A0A9D3WUC9_9SAUR|nr:hypothetical protein KIL84_002684 [Mauremys mutica]
MEFTGNLGGKGGVQPSFKITFHRPVEGAARPNELKIPQWTKSKQVNKLFCIYHKDKKIQKKLESPPHPTHNLKKKRGNNLLLSSFMLQLHQFKMRDYIFESF